jgi:hypothetical protein
VPLAAEPRPHVRRKGGQDRFRITGCPLDLQYDILGHEKITVASGYGLGSPMSIVKPWVELID